MVFRLTICNKAQGGNNKRFLSLHPELQHTFMQICNISQKQITESTRWDLRHLFANLPHRHCSLLNQDTGKGEEGVPTSFLVLLLPRW